MRARVLGSALMLALLASACGPTFESGRTQCGDGQSCPAGFRCGGGPQGDNRCYAMQGQSCPDGVAWVCADATGTITCWANYVTCDSVIECGDTSHACTSANQVADCVAKQCVSSDQCKIAGAPGSCTACLSHKCCSAFAACDADAACQSQQSACAASASQCVQTSDAAWNALLDCVGNDFCKTECANGA
jgi:hypothetical protein